MHLCFYENSITSQMRCTSITLFSFGQQKTSIIQAIRGDNAIVRENAPKCADEKKKKHEIRVWIDAYIADATSLFVPILFLSTVVFISISLIK